MAFFFLKKTQRDCRKNEIVWVWRIKLCTDLEIIENSINEKIFRRKNKIKYCKY